MAAREPGPRARYVALVADKRSDLHLVDCCRFAVGRCWCCCFLFAGKNSRGKSVAVLVCREIRPGSDGRFLPAAGPLYGSLALFVAGVYGLPPVCRDL